MCKLCPEEIDEYKNEPEIDVYNCHNLVTIPVLKELISLTVIYCPNLRHIEIQPELMKLMLINCPKITQIYQHPRLENLHLEELSSMRAIPIIPSLRYLEITDSHIGHIHRQPSLIELHIERCKKIEEIEEMPNLMYLDIENSPVKYVYPQPNLQNLWITRSPYILPYDESYFPRLNRLTITDNYVEYIPSYPELINLQVGNCPSLKILPKSSKLSILSLTHIDNISKIPYYPVLRELTCRYCDNLVTIHGNENLHIECNTCPSLMIIDKCLLRNVIESPLLYPSLACSGKEFYSFVIFQRMCRRKIRQKHLKSSDILRKYLPNVLVIMIQSSQKMRKDTVDLSDVSEYILEKQKLSEYLGEEYLGEEYIGEEYIEEENISRNKGLLNILNPFRTYRNRTPRGLGVLAINAMLAVVTNCCIYKTLDTRGNRLKRFGIDVAISVLTIIFQNIFINIAEEYERRKLNCSRYG